MTIEQAHFLAEARWVLHVREEMDCEQSQESRWIYLGTKGRRTWGQPVYTGTTGHGDYLG